MRIANLAGRAALVVEGGAVDVAEASAGRFGPDPMSPYQDWAAFTEWARSGALPAPAAYRAEDLGPAVPSPSQIFAIGLNYRDHAAESNLAEPEHPMVFTKFASCLTGPFAEVALTSDSVDYETELVVVMGRGGRDIVEADVWDHVAGLCVGQDISDRGVQWQGPAPQFSLGKSFAGFGPLGPAVVTLDEVTTPLSLAVRAWIEREGGGRDLVQDGTTADLIFSVPALIAELSRSIAFRPGDLVFTGTPAGVGAARGRFLAAGDVLVSEIEHVGLLRNRFRG